MAIDDGLSLAEQVVTGIRTESEIADELRKELRARARRRRIGGFSFPVFNLLLENGCNYIIEDGNGVYLLEDC